jgi:hypothetical protein
MGNKWQVSGTKYQEGARDEGAKIQKDYRGESDTRQFQRNQATILNPESWNLALVT